MTAAGTIASDRSFHVLGVRVNGVQIPDVISKMEHWISARECCRYIAVTGMHGVTEAQQEPAFKAILKSADLVVPDGMPLVWIARFRGFKLKRRVYGPELMLSFCESTNGKRYRHFFYGGTQSVCESLIRELSTRFPGIEVAGFYCPPFRPLTTEEDGAIICKINESRADILWVGLSTPKQEHWMHAHRQRICVPVLVGVGAAFDINAGAKRQAPALMREHGFEWLFRLLQEPRRLWRRYIIYGLRFVWLVTLEAFGIRDFE